VLYILPILSSLAWSFYLHLAKRIQVVKLLIMLFFIQFPFTLSLFSRNILLRTLSSNTLSLCSSLNVRHQVSHPHRTTSEIIVSYILISSFWTEDEKTTSTTTGQ
jgi:hypothetical protein